MFRTRSSVNKNSPVGKMFIFIFITALLCGFLNASIFAAPKPISEEGKKLASQVRSLNMINSLNLTRKQMQALIPVLKESEKAKNNFESYLKQNDSRNTAMLREMKTQLLSSNDVTKDVKQKFKDNKVTFDRKYKAYEATMTSLTQKVKGILNENQLVLVGEYQPCLVPVRSISNPERIGQAGATEKYEKVLRRSRKGTSRRYNKYKKKVTAKLNEKLEKKIKDEQQRKAYIQKVTNAMDQARNMSDEDFEMKKDELIKSLELPAKTTVTRRKKKKSKTDLYIARFILNPDLLPVLEYKVRNWK